jgi:hypothetical protein
MKTTKTTSIKLFFIGILTQLIGLLALGNYKHANPQDRIVDKLIGIPIVFIYGLAVFGIYSAISYILDTRKVTILPIIGACLNLVWFLLMSALLIAVIFFKVSV